MDELSQQWMAYIDAEVRAACRQRGLGYQVRRKWTVREKPVSASPVDDYEWKLVPGAQGELPDQAPGEDFYCRYYLLGLDRAVGKFILHHDNHHGGDESEMGLATFTEIRLLDLHNPDLMRVWAETDYAVADLRIAPPPRPGWLCEMLVLLTERFQPNWSSLS